MGIVTSATMQWKKFDYGDKLPVSEGLAALSGWTQGALEEKQCMLINTAGAYLLAQKLDPSLSEVLTLAQSWREELFERAQEASLNLGESPPLITGTEHDLRIFCHDALEYNHDKDFR
eukprot:6449746-Amphidinium_carterae.1